MSDECGTKPKLGWKRYFTLSKHQKDQLRLFMPSIVCFSVATILYTVYICEWKEVLQYMPYYNLKWKTVEKTDEEEAKKDRKCK